MDPFQEIWDQVTVNLIGIKADYVFVIGAVLSVELLLVAYLLISRFLQRLRQGYTEEEYREYAANEDRKYAMSSRSAGDNIRAKYGAGGYSKRYEGQL